MADFLVIAYLIMVAGASCKPEMVFQAAWHDGIEHLFREREPVFGCL